MAMMQGMRWRVPNWLWRDLPLVLGALAWLSSLTNLWHGQFITPIPGSRSEYGVFWYANGSVLWTLVLCTVLLAIYRHREVTCAIDRAQMRLCALSAAFPTVLNATYTLAPNPVDFDPRVVGLAISTSMLVFSVYRGQLHPAITVCLEEWIGYDPLPGVLMDRNGRILFANKAVNTLFGSTPERTSMTTWLADQLMMDGATPDFAVMEAEPSRLWQLRRDPERWVQLERRPIKLRGSELGTALFVHEETQRVRMDAALQSVRQVESLGLIGGGVAHDFNNLLVSITGNAELAELFADSDPARVREYLARIRRAGEQGADLARQLLTYAGRGSIALVPIELNAVLTRTIEIRRASMPSNISVQLDLAQNQALVAYADTAHLAQIALNLVVNAEEVLSTKGGVIRIATGHKVLTESALKGMLGAQACTPGEFVYMVVRMMVRACRRKPLRACLIRSSQPRPLASMSPATQSSARKISCLSDNAANQAIGQGLFRAHPVIPISVLRHALKGLTGPVSNHPIDPFASLDDFPGMNRDIRGIATKATCRLMNQKAGIWQAKAIFALCCQIDVRSDAAYPTGADTTHDGFDELDHVIDDISRFHVPAG